MKRRRLLFNAALAAGMLSVRGGFAIGRPACDGACAAPDGVDNPESPDAAQLLVRLGSDHARVRVDPLAPIAAAPDTLAPDYAHLRSGFEMSQFRVDPELLERLATINRFALTTPIVLVGLRGASLVDGPRDAASLRLVERRIDYRRFACVLAVWDRTRGRITGFPGSTVPNHLFIRQQWLTGFGEGVANQLPTGLYRQQVGTHGGDTTAPQAGAFRMEQRIAVRRALGAMRYELASPMALTRPYDNVHASGRSTDETDFSSAGCQTLRGWYDATSGEPVEDYARFREAAGLGWPHDASRDGTEFDYLLLTGRDARLAALDTWPRDTLRLRAGSSGNEVRAAQEILARGDSTVERDGVAGPATVASWARWQLATHRATDATLTHEQLHALGI